MVLINKHINDNEPAEAVSFGLDAKHSYITTNYRDKNYLFFERFKMSLYGLLCDKNNNNIFT